jgi:hypothetical protein
MAAAAAADGSRGRLCRKVNEGTARCGRLAKEPPVTCPGHDPVTCPGHEPIRLVTRAGGRRRPRQALCLSLSLCYPHVPPPSQLVNLLPAASAPCPATGPCRPAALISARPGPARPAAHTRRSESTEGTSPPCPPPLPARPLPCPRPRSCPLPARPPPCPVHVPLPARAPHVPPSPRR